MDLFLNKRSVEKFKVPAVVAAKNDARTQKISLILFGFRISRFFFRKNPTKLNNAIDQCFVHYFNAIGRDVGFGYFSVFDL